VATVPEIPVLRVSVRDDDSAQDTSAPGISVPTWAPVDVPRGQRFSSIVLAALGVLAGIGAMGLGAVAVLSASSTPGTDTTAPRTDGPKTAVEARVLSLLAKPSTERIVFKRSGGKLVLVVGSGGRAAILVRGLQRPATAKPLSAWVVAPGSAPVRAAHIGGAERAVFLSVPVGPEASVVVSSERPARQTTRSSVVASRG
jgi:hypothetical protein